jgi:nitroimidazol reductase NimA-like FMN-containing flavoprotein (pyridoxamine 5'-phosphate oxidase superfamily)
VSSVNQEQHGGSRTARALTRAEIEEILERGCWGVLAMIDGDVPYATQIIYGYTGQDFVFASAPGHKYEVLQKNPRVSFVITEVEDCGKRWRSVIVKGTVEWIEELGGKLSAFNALRKQVPSSTPRLRDASKLVSAKVGRIVPAEITGRSAG